jgi:serine phosphatase RsbU (regulator of sigma subunit)
LLPLLFRADAGTVTASMPSEFSGWPMGILQDQTYKDWLLPLAPGDCLILFSDGVIDATSTGGERFTLKGVRNALLDEGPRNPRALGQRVVKAVKRHASGRSQIDDITILCLGRLVP